MKNEILSRYDRDPDGRFVIGVRSESCDALFNAYDFASSLSKRDLKTEVAEYLIESAQEIGRRNEFLIRVVLPEAEERRSTEQRLEQAVHGYFSYRISLARKAVRTVVARIVINLAVALALLVVIFVLEKARPRSDSIWSRIFFEGLYIAIWVLMWPLFSEFLFELRSSLRQIRLYRRIMAAELQIRCRHQ